MKFPTPKTLFTLALLVFLLPTDAATHRANSAGELAKVCRAIQPGDTILLSAGTYTDQHLVFTGTGTAEKPILLQAETPGKTVLNGSSRLSIGGEHLVVDGLLFRDGGLDPEGGDDGPKAVISFRGPDAEARHCVLRNTAVMDYNPTDPETRYFWVSLFGYGNRVEYCSFAGQAHSGVTVCVQLDSGEPAGHTIHRNHFANRPEGNGNGFETIRIGTGSKRMTNARCTVSENLFERCNGEIEIVSNKSCENVYRGNTFLDCSGTLTIRQGDRVRIENNVFIGGDNPDAGGLRVTGADHRITGNFFSGTKGRAGGAVSLRAGTPDAARGDYPQVRNCLIDANTFVDNPGALFALDAGYNPNGDRLLPEDVVISNSLMVVPEGAARLINSDVPTPGIRLKGNIVVGDHPGVDLGAGLWKSDKVPVMWEERLNPQPLTRDEVGAPWL